MSTHTLLNLLADLGLPQSDYAVFGSGPLLVRGIISESNDLDVICRGPAWERVKAIGTLTHNDVYNVDIVSMHDEQLTFGMAWGIGDFDIDQLIDEAELIDGIPFVRLKHVIAYKQARGSDKDQRHIAAFRRAGEANI